MEIFTDSPEYDRRTILDAASRARVHKHYRRAVALYRRVLAVEPGNVELHLKLAPLLAATHQHFDAWTSFRFCARAALRDKRLELAAAIYREAARCLPREVRAWEKLAKTEIRQRRSRQALEALREGRLQFRGRRWRPQAIALLRRALEIDPSGLEIALDLSRQLAKAEQESEAQLLLERLASRCSASELARVRLAHWRIAPTLGNTWRWLYAASTSGRRESEELSRPRRVAT